LKFIRGVARKINDLSIRNKLFILFLALVTVPICLLLIINLYFTSKESEQRAEFTMNQVLNQSDTAIEFKTESINNLINILAMNSTLQDLSQKSKSLYDQDMGLWIIDNQNLTKALYFTFENPSISSSSLHFYMKEGLASVATNNEYMQLGSITGTEWYKKFAANNFSLSWYAKNEIVEGSGADSVCALKGIPSSQSLSDIVGIIRLDIPLSIFKTPLDQSLFTKSTSAFLINSRNEVICSSGILGADDGEKLIGMLPVSSDDWKTVKIDNEEYMLGAHKISYTDWRLLLAVPYKDILAFNINTRNQTILIFLIVAPLTLPLSFLVSNSATKRIRKLIFHMKKAESGNFDVSVRPGNNDEIGQLTRSFNYMLARMEGLLDDKFKLGREMKNLEVKALQAQINPHFLYNTLDLINWMSIRNNVPEISGLVEALGRFYKLSLSRGEDIVSIGNEIEHVKTYVKIQNMRFNNNINLEINFPEELLGYSIVKIVLQPIVENAILHGILEKDDEKGTIQIEGFLENNTIRINVKDDGIGMNDSRIREILSGESTLEPHGYGVHNINERLRLNYGNEYGLTFVSEEGKYTIATVRIPALILDAHSSSFKFDL